MKREGAAVTCDRRLLVLVVRVMHFGHMLQLAAGTDFKSPFFAYFGIG